MFTSFKVFAMQKRGISCYEMLTFKLVAISRRSCVSRRETLNDVSNQRKWSVNRPGNSTPPKNVVSYTMPKKKETEQPKVHKDLEGFQVGINEFGEITSSFNVEKLNHFLNKEVDDKKLRDRDDLDFIQEKEKKKKDQSVDPA